MEHPEDLDREMANDFENECRDRGASRLELPLGLWKTSDGREVTIESMASRHLENTIKKLHREGKAGSSKCLEMIGELDRRHGVDALPAEGTQVSMPSTSTPTLPRSGAVPDDRVGFVRLIMALAFSDANVAGVLNECAGDVDELSERLIFMAGALIYPGKSRDAFQAVARRELGPKDVADMLATWEGKPARVAAFLRDRLEQEIAQSLEVLSVPKLPEPAGVSL